VRDWQNDAPREIAKVHDAMPGCTPEELRKALRKHAWQFHCGTSWGKRVWSRHCRAYMAKLTGNGHYSGTGKAIEWPADIAFPWKGQAGDDPACREFEATADEPILKARAG